MFLLVEIGGFYAIVYRYRKRDLLFLFVIDALERSYSKRNWGHLTVAAAVQAVGMVTSAHEIVQTVS